MKEIKKDYWMFWIFSKQKTAEVAFKEFADTYGHKPTKYTCHPEDHSLITIRSVRFRRTSCGPLPMKGQMYLQ